MKKVTINIGGQPVEADVMPFNPIEEPWSTYRLEDGTIFKLRPVVSTVIRLPQNDPLTGLPQLMIQSSNIVSVEPPDALLGRKDVQ